MKKYTFCKIGFSASKSIGWTGDYYSLLIIDGEEYATFTVKVGYEGINPIEEHLKWKGYKPMYQSNQVYGQIKPREYKEYIYDTIEDIKEWVEKK